MQFCISNKYKKLIYYVLHPLLRYKLCKEIQLLHHVRQSLQLFKYATNIIFRQKDSYLWQKMKNPSGICISKAIQDLQMKQSFLYLGRCCKLNLYKSNFLNRFQICVVDSNFKFALTRFNFSKNIDTGMRLCSFDSSFQTLQCLLEGNFWYLTYFLRY